MMKAAELFAKTLHGYSTIPPELNVTLSTYCKYRKVNYRGLRDWMQVNKIPAPKSSKRAIAKLPVSTIAPLTILSPASSDRRSLCLSDPTPVSMLKDVQIIFPGGVQISIGAISGKEMTGLITTLKPD
jgi:hypothetical protein